MMGGFCRVILAALLAGACQPSHPEYFGTVVPHHGPDEVWINNGNEPEWLDPGRLADSAGSEIVSNIFAGLLQYHPQTLEPIPELAERWDRSDDGRHYVFHLRRSVWSDGTPVTARDFEWSWKRVLDPATGSKYASMAYVLLNGSAVNRRAVFVPAAAPAGVRARLSGLTIDAIEAIEWPAPGSLVFAGGPEDGQAAVRERVLTTFPEARIAGAELAGVRALDDSTLEVRLQSAVPYFLSLMCFYTFLPVPRHRLESLAQAGLNPDLWTRTEHIVVNGAYRPTEHVFQQYYRFERNPTYWDAANVHIDKVRLILVGSYNTGLNLYRTGEIDWTGGNVDLPNEFKAHLARFRDYHRDPYLGVYFYWFNTAAPPLDDARVRRALSLAIDRQALVDRVTRGGQLPMADLVPDGLAGYRGLATPPFDPVKARALLAEAGYGPARPLPRTVLRYNTFESHKQVAVAVQQMWRDHLGVDVEIENQEWKVFLKTLELNDFQIARMGWIGDYADPYTFLELLSAHNGNNHSQWSDPTYDKLLITANATTDPVLRLEVLRQAEQILAEAAPVLPIYLYSKSSMVKPYLRGYTGNYLDNHAWKYFSIDERFYDGVPAMLAELEH